MAILKRKDETRRGLTRQTKRPVPDEAPLAESEQPAPQPERQEPELHDPGLRDLSTADYKAIAKRAGKEFMNDNCMMLASALAYSSFFAIPSVITVAVGLFTLIASPATIVHVIDQLHGVIPGQATSLLKSSLLRADAHPAGSIAMTIIGFVLAVWSVTGAMTSYMTALNIAHDLEKDRRPFLRKRTTALKMAAIIACAFVLIAALLMFGPVIQRAIARDAGSAHALVTVLWWVLEWPLLLVGLLTAFAALLYLGPDVEQRKWEFLTPGSLLAVLIWLGASGLFAVYTATFASYNKTWGSLSAVIVMLTWLWITGMALLLGAEINAEAERSRQLRARE